LTAHLVTCTYYTNPPCSMPDTNFFSGRNEAQNLI
jgi:hypothetical protein